MSFFTLSVNMRVFLSTYPVRGTTDTLKRALDSLSISIHVPRAGYDRCLMR